MLQSKGHNGEGLTEHIGLISSTPKKCGGFFPEFSPPGVCEISPINGVTTHIPQVMSSSCSSSGVQVKYHFVIGCIKYPKYLSGFLHIVSTFRVLNK